MSACFVPIIKLTLSKATGSWWVSVPHRYHPHKLLRSDRHEGVEYWCWFLFWQDLLASPRRSVPCRYDASTEYLPVSGDQAVLVGNCDFVHHPTSQGFRDTHCSRFHAKILDTSFCYRILRIRSGPIYLHDKIRCSCSIR